MPHIHDKIDFTVEVFIVYKNTVLLRMHDKYKIWLSVGGHIELNEDPNQAAIREVKEETGLDITLVGKPVDPDEPGDYKELLSPRFLNRHRVNDTHEHVTLVYFALAEDNNIVEDGDEMSGDMHWFTEEELDDERYGIFKNIKHYAKSALEGSRNKN